MDEALKNLEQDFQVAPSVELAEKLMKAYDRADQTPSFEILPLLLDTFQEEEDLNNIFKAIGMIAESERRQGKTSHRRKTFLKLYARRTKTWYGILEIAEAELNYWNKFLAKDLGESYPKEIYSSATAAEQICYIFDFDSHYSVDVKVIGGEEPYVDAPMFLDGHEISLMEPSTELDGYYYFEDDEKGIKFVLLVKAL